tara:strand:- start:175 stop:684 length:510 start_codon:yes stop_codon:yes gene_type:complete
MGENKMKQLKLEKSLRTSMNKVHDIFIANAKSSLSVLEKGREEYENNPSYEAEKEHQSSKNMYEAQKIIFNSIIKYSFADLVIGINKFGAEAMRLKDCLDAEQGKILGDKLKTYEEMYHSDQLKLVMGVAQIEVDGSYFEFQKGVFSLCEKITTEQLDGRQLEIVSTEK